MDNLTITKQIGLAFQTLITILQQMNIELL